MLRVDPSSAPPLRVLPLADSNRVRVGDAAIAIGYPLGLDRTATAGIVSGLGREIRAPNGFTIDEVIQTDAPINPGNSGGPLIDANGRVIGVNSQIATAGSQGNVGIGFAVPANTVREVVPSLKGGQAIERPYLGVSTSPSLNGRGAVVQEVTPGGPAEGAGIKASSGPLSEDGDVIVGIDGRAVTEPDDVAQAIEGKKPGDKVTVRVLRNGTETDIEVTLGERPARGPVSFERPLLLLGLLAIPVVAYWYVLAHRARQPFASPALVPAVAPRRPGLRRHWPMALYALGLAALILAVAKPQRAVSVPVDRASVLLVTDRSGSMQAEDVDAQPPRGRAGRGQGVRRPGARPRPRRARRVQPGRRGRAAADDRQAGGQGRDRRDHARRRHRHRRRHHAGAAHPAAERRTTAARRRPRSSCSPTASRSRGATRSRPRARPPG